MEFPLWLRLSHFVNFILIILLFRSGLQILARHPKLYLDSDQLRTGKPWLSLPVPDRENVSKHSEHGAMDAFDAEAASSIDVPRSEALIDHKLCACFWILNGVLYVLLLFVDDEWRRIVPDSLQIFKSAFDEFLMYLSLRFNTVEHLSKYGALQQLSYFIIVFLIAPLSILSGAVVSPAISRSCPWLVQLFGGRQTARTIHILLIAYYAIFTLCHVLMVSITGWDLNLNRIVLGTNLHGPSGTLIAIIASILLYYLCDRLAVGKLAKPANCLKLEVSDQDHTGDLPEASNETGSPISIPEQVSPGSGSVRDQIKKLLTLERLQTCLEPFPENDREFEAILKELRQIKDGDLRQKLIVAGFTAEPVHDRKCFECIYYKTKMKHCELPELDLPVEEYWWCRLWRV